MACHIEPSLLHWGGGRGTIGDALLGAPNGCIYRDTMCLYKCCLDRISWNTVVVGEGTVGNSRHQHTCKPNQDLDEVPKGHHSDGTDGMQRLMRKLLAAVVDHVHLFKSSTSQASVLGSQSPCCEISWNLLKYLPSTCTYVCMLAYK